MAKKPRLKDSAFDWAEEKASAEKTPMKRKIQPAQSKKKEAVASTEKQNGATSISAKTATRKAKKRVIFVQYKKDDGQIVAMQEILHKPEKAKAPPWLEIPDDREARRINLTADIADKKLIEIHQNYKVKKSGRTVKLVPKG